MLPACAQQSLSLSRSQGGICLWVSCCLHILPRQACCPEQQQPVGAWTWEKFTQGGSQQRQPGSNGLQCTEKDTLGQHLRLRSQRRASAVSVVGSQERNAAQMQFAALIQQQEGTWQ